MQRPLAVLIRSPKWLATIGLPCVVGCLLLPYLSILCVIVGPPLIWFLCRFSGPDKEIGQWLRARANVEEIDELIASSPEKFRERCGWNEIRANLKPGDEIWHYESPQETWDKLRGRAGICVRRDGKVIEAIQTRMN